MNINPIYIINKIYELENYLKSNMLNGVELFICLIYDYLSPKKILKTYKFSKIAFDYLIENIKKEFNACKMVNLLHR